MHAANAAHPEILTEDESLLRAAFIYNFTKFTSWPDNTVRKQDSPLFICTIGKDQLVNALTKLNNIKIQEHKVVIRSLKNRNYTDNCNVLYVASSEKKFLNKIIRVNRGKPILTISGIRNFAQDGGVIEFFREKGKTRFIINLDAATNAGLEISSRLLILAVVIDSETTK